MYGDEKRARERKKKEDKKFTYNSRPPTPLLKNVSYSYHQQNSLEIVVGLVWCSDLGLCFFFGRGPDFAGQ